VSSPGLGRSLGPQSCVGPMVAFEHGTHPLGRPLTQFISADKHRLVKDS
jgi:hypothetical protein